MSWKDFSDAEEQTGDVIPHGTIAKVRLKIRPGGYNDANMGLTGDIATRSDNTGAIYLDAEYTVMGGKFAKRKVWSLIGLHSPKGPKWQAMGRAFIRAALESARGIAPDDTSERAMKARQINSLQDLDGLEFVAKIDVEKADEGSGYDDKNKINTVIGVKHKDYAAHMGGAAPAANTPAPAPASAANTPAWAQ
jgi:hypothetical protein